MSRYQERANRHKKVKIDSFTKDFIRGLHIKSQGNLNRMFKAIDIKFKNYCERCNYQKDLCSMTSMKIKEDCVISQADD